MKVEFLALGRDGAVTAKRVPAIGTPAVRVPAIGTPAVEARRAAGPASEQGAGRARPEPSPRSHKTS